MLPFCLLALCGCKAPYRDIVGPYSGATYRFVVDQLALPRSRSDFADDLNGDGRVDNQLGNIAGQLGANDDLTDAVDDLLGSGAWAPVVEITSDDPRLRDDPTVGVRFFGRDGEAADELGGALRGGTLRTNPTRLTRVPASATVHLPLFAHADPLVVPAIGLEAELVADGDGGFDCTLRGAFPAPAYREPAFAGLRQMIAANPQEFPILLALLDADHDTVVSDDELAGSALIENLLPPDVELTDGNGRWAPSPDNARKDALAFAVRMHLVPCAAGSCHAPPAEPCRDRVLDGGESDVDCGGACLACPGGARCAVDGDCQSRQCRGGVCAAPSCSDGVQDGGEPAVDCGYGCSACPPGSSCRSDGDCTTGYCAGDEFFALGACRVPLCSDGVRDNDETDVDCGGHCPGCARSRACDGDEDCASHLCDVTCANGSCSGVCA